MTPNDILRSLVERLESSFPDPAIFDHDEISVWPETTVHQLLQLGLLVSAQRAESVICDGCALQCTKRVTVRTMPKSRSIRAVIICDEEPALGFISVAQERLNRYSTSIALLASFFSSNPGFQSVAPVRHRMPILLGRMNGRFGQRDVLLVHEEAALWLVVGQHREQFTQLATWHESAPQLDLKVLRRLINRKQRSGRHTRYLPDRTDQRAKSRRTVSENRKILAEAKRLKSETGQSWTTISEMVAEMPFLKDRKGRRGALSAQRIRRIICDLQKG